LRPGNGNLNPAVETNILETCLCVCCLIKKVGWNRHI
jgi:hypothetical protein